MKKVIFLILFLITNAVSQEWTATQKSLFTSYITANIVDAGQTNFAMKRTNCVEYNTLYGKNPSLTKIVLYKTTAIGLIYLFTNKLPSNEKTILLYGLNVLQWGIVAHNSQYVGVKLNFTF